MKREIRREVTEGTKIKKEEIGHSEDGVGSVEQCSGRGNHASVQDGWGVTSQRSVCKRRWRKNSKRRKRKVGEVGVALPNPPDRTEGKSETEREREQ